MKKFVLTTLIIGTATLAIAQTNAVAVVNIAPSTVADIAKVFQDFGINLTIDGMVKLFAIAFIVARVFRKYAPESLQKSPLAHALSHIALEINSQAQAAAKATPPVSVQTPLANPPAV